MRVTGNRLIEMQAATTSANQAKVATAAAEASSGLRVAKPSDDPAAWMTAQRATMRKTLAEGAASALNAGKERLDLVDGALAGIGEAVSQIRLLATQGANASYNANDRREIGVQVRAFFEAALTSANTRAGDGEYILAGSRSTTQPFSATGAYAGDADARQLPAADSIVASSTIAGSALTAANGVDVLPLLDKVATALSNNDLTGLNSLLGDLGKAVQQVSLTRTRVGGVMNVVNAALTANDDLDAHLTNTIANAVEADVFESASNLAKASQSLEASRTVTSHIVGLLDPRAS
jgi:flagellar hook-associated protein 3 FlgL